MKEYSTLENKVYVAENVIEKSRFLAYVKGVDSVEEAVDFVAQIKKKHFDATHNCYGYVFDDKAKFSDDGEPQGTAGMPIYECIKNCKLNRVVVVVTRYFGGIKLGAGGLVRAYNGTASLGLNGAKRVEMRHCATVDVKVDYSLLKVAQRTAGEKAILKNTIYDTDVCLQYLVLASQVQPLTEVLIEKTNGQAKINVTGQLLCPYGE
jgi:uncharacterized YigZ family protein